jgi:molybdopterin synthase sulfur carrier subunit
VIRVKIYTILALKEIVGQRELEISISEGSTVKNLISWMVETWGDRLSSHLFQPGSDRLLPHIRLMVNGRDIAFLNGMETLLQEGDEFLMLPLVTGG